MKEIVSIIILMISVKLCIGQINGDTILLGDSLTMIQSPELKATLDYASYMDSIATANKSQLKESSDEYWESGTIKVMYEQDLKGGLDDYNIALSLDSTNVKVYNSRAFAFLMIGDSLKAFNDYNKAIHFCDTISVLFYNRADYYMDIAQYDSALTDINEAIELDSTVHDSYYLKGKILFEQENYVESINAFLKTLGLSPNTIGSYHWIGLNYLKLDDLTQSCKYFKMAVTHGYHDSEVLLKENCK